MRTNGVPAPQLQADGRDRVRGPAVHTSGPQWRGFWPSSLWLLCWKIKLPFLCVSFFGSFFLPSQAPCLLLHRDAREESFAVLGEGPQGSVLARSQDTRGFPPAPAPPCVNWGKQFLSLCLSGSLPPAIAPGAS